MERVFFFVENGEEVEKSYKKEVGSRVVRGWGGAESGRGCKQRVTQTGVRGETGKVAT